MVIEAADCEAQMNVVEWVRVNPVRVLRVFLEELHVWNDVDWLYVAVVS